MDAGFLNYHKEEEFSSLFLEPSDVSGCYDDVRNHLYTWEWDSERELNGDIGLIPTISNHLTNTSSDFCPISTSPPTNSDDFHRIVSDWQNAVKLDHDIDDLTVDVKICTNDVAKYIQNSGCHTSINQFGNCQTNFDNEDKFDLTEYINDIDDRQRLQNNSKGLKTGGKKIDINAQRYVLDDEEDCDSEDDAVDVETLSDSDQTSPLVLQATDVNTLLEQFEANETTNSEIKQKEMDTNALTNIKQEITIIEEDIKVEPEDNDFPEDNDYEFDMKVKLPNFVEETGYLKPTPIDDIISNKRTKLDLNNSSSPIKDHIDQLMQVDDVNNKNTSYANVPNNSNNNSKETSRQILNALPTELINRIRQNSKRKPITVIPPIIPVKKRSQSIQNPPEKAVTIILDHTYCTKSDLKNDLKAENKILTIPRKDSGFSSAEEDEQRAILRLQPKVKNADGTLMVSLLKANTIISNQNPTKKKLNLEEYKKRRSQNFSGQNSPLLDEDENTRRLRHQEMLMKMAYEVINNQNKETNINNNNEINEGKEKLEIKEIIIPQNIIKKTLVSTGTNTEESWGHVEQILEKTKILPPHSLISSIVETLPLIKIEPNQQQNNDSTDQHGEDKTISYIDANIPKPKAKSASTQTIRTTMKSTQSQHIQQRRQIDRRQRQISRSSSSSSSSSTSTSSRSSSRSRSPSPIHRKRVELERVVEERRVIYVGRIEDGMTREELRRRFAKFGPICNVSTHFRTEADNYGFVTFVNKEDAYTAVEYGNADPADRQYDLSFGGRRLFCQQKYSDLDRVNDTDTDTYYLYNSDCPVSLLAQSSQISIHHQQQIMQHHQTNQSSSSSFDSLLRAAQAKLQRKRQQLLL